MQGVILTQRQEQLMPFVQGLGLDMTWTEAPEEILEQASDAPWVLVVIDALMPTLDYRQLLMDLLQVNAMLNTVVLTTMTSTEFHDHSEGLGVLCAVEPEPKYEQGQEVAELLQAVLG